MLQTLERLILDPISEPAPYGQAANRPIEVTGGRAPSPEGHGVFLADHQYPRPEFQSTYAGSRDSQGEKRFGKPKPNNRKIPIKVFITEAQGVGAVTNLAINPAGEVAKKWIDGGDYAIVRELGTSSVPSLSGEFRDKHPYDGSASSQVLGSLNVTFPAAGTYVVSVFVWLPAAWDGKAPVLKSNGTYAGSSAEVQTAADLTKRDQWQRIQTKITVVAGDLVGTFSLDNQGQPSSAGTGVMYTDALQIESGAEATAFLCGDTPGCSWNGEPNNSTSTRVGSGSDRKRFIQSLYDLQEKIEKLAEEGGTLKRILPDGSWMVFDVEEALFVGNWERRFNQGQEEFSFELICSPGARLAPITKEVHTEAALPVLTFTEINIPGNLPAFGDLMIEEAQGQNRNFFAVALASRFLDTSANGEVFYQAEARKVLSGASVEASTGASGAGSNAVRCPLFEEFTPYLSTTSSGGAYLSHVGAHKIFARVKMPAANTGAISFKLEYAQGDLLRWRGTNKGVVEFPAGVLENEWVLIDLGVVRLNRAVVGTQRWEGRVSVKSTVAGDLAFIDHLVVMPCEEFYAEARKLDVPSTSVGPLVARDVFAGTEGTALTGRAATVGGSWSLIGGDADDWVLTGANGARRKPSKTDAHTAENDDANFFPYNATGRYLRLGVGTKAGVSVTCGITGPNNLSYAETAAVIARYVDIKNMLMARVIHAPGLSTGYRLQVWKKKLGVWELLNSSAEFKGIGGVACELNLTCYASGSGFASLKLAGGATVQTVSWLTDADLKTGGTLQTGGYGIYHKLANEGGTEVSTLGGPLTVTFSNFNVREASEVVLDAALYANKKARVRWDKAVREAIDGSGAQSDIGLYGGDRLLVPNSGREGRPVRFAVLASRGLPEEEFDSGIDDIKATLTVTPRVIEVPEPS